jgi:hypothetical protein
VAGFFCAGCVEPAGSATGELATNNDDNNYDYPNEIIPDVG